MMRGDSKQYEPRILGANARERVALHEAAHAVAAKAYGLSVSYAEIYTEAWDGRLGQMSFSSKRNSHAWARAVVSLAGPQGELAFCGDEYGSDRDFEDAEQDAWKFDPDNGDEVMRLAKVAAMMVVRDNRPLISIVAIILEYRDILLDEEIDRIISRTVGNVEPGPGFPDMSLECARQDAARRRNRRDYEGAEFIERWIRQQERAR